MIPETEQACDPLRRSEGAASARATLSAYKSGAASSELRFAGILDNGRRLVGPDVRLADRVPASIGVPPR
jgi:hypothetical protein